MSLVNRTCLYISSLETLAALQASFQDVPDEESQQALSRTVRLHLGLAVVFLRLYRPCFPLSLDYCITYVLSIILFESMAYNLTCYINQH